METKAKRTPSTAVQAAKLIREELKKAFPATQFRVKSEVYSGGSSVDVYYTDGPTERKVMALIGKYQYGHFDGSTDCYEYSNSRQDVPQVKFVFANRELSDTFKAKLMEQVAQDQEAYLVDRAIYRLSQDTDC